VVAEFMTVPHRDNARPKMGNPDNSMDKIHGSAGDDLIASVTEMWVLPLFVKTFATNGKKGRQAHTRPAAP
jgi:hypothetical protein